MSWVDTVTPDQWAVLALYVVSFFGSLEVMFIFIRMNRNFTLVTFSAVYVVYVLVVMGFYVSTSEHCHSTYSSEKWMAMQFGDLECLIDATQHHKFAHLVQFCWWFQAVKLVWFDH